MKYLNSKLVHIYGFSLNNTDQCEIKSPAKLYKLPFYGTTECTDDSNNKLHYIGIEIGTNANPFDVLYVEHQGIFQMSNVVANDYIIKLMNSLYPNYELKCHSFLLNVCTSQYYEGLIMLGYFFSFNDIQHTEDDLDPYCMNLLEIINEVIDNKNNYKILSVAHTANKLGDYFLGIRLSENFVRFNFSHNEDPGNKFYQLTHTSYNINDYADFNLTFKNNFMTSAKVIAFVPTMCYCCT